MPQNNWVRGLQLPGLCSRARGLQLLKPAHPRARLCNKRSHRTATRVVSARGMRGRTLHAAVKTQGGQK